MLNPHAACSPANSQARRHHGATTGPWVAILVSSALSIPYIAGSRGRILKTSRPQGANVHARQDEEPAKHQAPGDGFVVEPCGQQNSHERDDHEPARGARRRPSTRGP